MKTDSDLAYCDGINMNIFAFISLTRIMLDIDNFFFFFLESLQDYRNKCKKCHNVAVNIICFDLDQDLHF